MENGKTLMDAISKERSSFPMNTGNSTLFLKNSLFNQSSAENTRYRTKKKLNLQSSNILYNNTYIRLKLCTNKFTCISTYIYMQNIYIKEFSRSHPLPTRQMSMPAELHPFVHFNKIEFMIVLKCKMNIYIFTLHVNTIYKVLYLLYVYMYLIDYMSVSTFSGSIMEI